MNKGPYSIYCCALSMHGFAFVQGLTTSGSVLYYEHHDSFHTHTIHLKLYGQPTPSTTWIDCFSHWYYSYNGYTMTVNVNMLTLKWNKIEVFRFHLVVTRECMVASCK